MTLRSTLRPLAAALALAVPLAAAASPRAPKPAPPVTRTAINTCDQAWLFTWPKDSSLPVRAHFPPAHAGEQFELLGEPHYTLDGKGYYETTVIVFGIGSEMHYWISDACVNPPPLKPNAASRP